MRGLTRRCVVAMMVVLCGAGVPLSAQSADDRSPLSQVAAPGPQELSAESILTPVVNLKPPVFYVDQVVTQPAGPPPTPRHTGVRALVKGIGTDFKHLPSRQNLFIAAVGGGLALAVHPLDDNVNRKLVGNSTAKHFFKAGEVLGESPTLFASAIAVYAVGRIKDQPKVSHLGMDLIRSLVMSEVLTQTLKYTTRRERPDLSGKNSFPSGHAADTFAFATTLERHLGWRGAIPAYAFSSYVALSRLPANRHWLSDAVFGAAVGVIAGRTVTRHGREYPVTVAFVPGGAAVLYVRRGKSIGVCLRRPQRAACENRRRLFQTSAVAIALVAPAEKTNMAIFHGCPVRAITRECHSAFNRTGEG